MIVINFNKEIYPLKALKEAIKAYAGLAKFSIQQEKKYIKVILDNIHISVKPIIKNEFCNYVLSLARKF